MRADMSAEDHAKVLAAADAMTRQLSGSRGRIWASIGVDFTPCTRNCKFCSLGEEWGVHPKPYELSTGEVCDVAREYVEGGAAWIVLRTTQDFPIPRLVELAREVRRRIPEHVELVVNTGEYGMEGARQLRDAGYSSVYHVVRLREGVDTVFHPADRESTIKAARQAGLGLTYLVEPLGPEHTDEEIAREAVRARQLGAAQVGAMARVPVRGTPLGGCCQVSTERLCRTVAVSRLAAGKRAKWVCVHPPTPEALRAGANILVVEAGAVPRDTGSGQGKWRGFGMAEAVDMLRSAGYEIAELSKPTGTGEPAAVGQMSPQRQPTERPASTACCGRSSPKKARGGTT